MNYKNVISNIENQIKDYVKNKGAMIGISGGVDSAVVATLSRNALGNHRVLGVLMPYGNQNMRDAITLLDFLLIANEEVNIKSIVDQYDFLKLDKISRGNIMTRTRMTLLYAFSNKLNGLVIGTSNKTEIELGYFTKYGDGGVDIEPIGDLYKTEVYDIAKILGIPKKILTRKPSAGLWKGQTDEDEIGVTYAEIDSVLRGEIKQGQVYETVLRLRKTSEHKRKMPPVFKG